MGGGRRGGGVEAARTYLAEYRKRPRTYLYYMKSFKDSGSRIAAFLWLSPRNIARSVRWLSERIVQSAMEPARDYMEQSPWWFLLDATRRKFRLMRGFGDLWDSYDPNDEYASYPLHLEPEMAMLLLGPRWTDQINLIKQVAESLPLSSKLYVKEHPVMMGFRPRRYYRELKKIPNVKLIHPNHDSHAIIKGAELIATITGTVGWEALLLRQPAITFWNVYYNAHSTVKKCTNIEELPSLVKEQLEFVLNEDETIRFIAALLEHSENLRLHEMWEKGIEHDAERASIAGFCELFLRYARQ